MVACNYSWYLVLMTGLNRKCSVASLHGSRTSLILRQLEGIILTGEKRELWQDEMVSMVEHFAIQNDCKRLCILARPGWSKIVKQYGWKVKNVELQKELI
jgi:hypothetical protein